MKLKNALNKMMKKFYFETFKKLILEPKLEDKNFKENCTDRKAIRRRSTRRNNLKN